MGTNQNKHTEVNIMVVQHNMQAANASRMLNITAGQQAKSTEKLSSGYRINRAADDAAGLSISEKMRKQIRGLDQASTNAQDGVSAVQTAEGALTEVHSMLQRMNELSVQASNGTNSKTDRDAIQSEIEQLTTEIDRVAETTKFNETYLLKGDADGKKSSTTINAHDAGLKGTLTNVGTGTATFKLDKELANDDKVTIGGKEYTIDDNAKAVTYGAGLDATGFGTTAAGTPAKITSSNNAVTVTGTYAGTADVTLTYSAADTAWKANGTKVDDPTATYGITIAGTPNNADTITLTAAKPGAYTAFADEDELLAAAKDGKTIYKGNNTTLAAAGDYTVNDNGNKITKADAYKLMATELETASSLGADAGTKATVTNNGDGTFSITEGSAAITASLSFNLHVGSDADMTNKINVDINTMNSSYLGIKGLDVSDKTGTAATYAIDAIADALQKVSDQRSSLGAIQNRLEHTIDNLDNVVENTTSAESRIRDTDMADEMVKYSKNNILQQAGQSMLAQANQSTQGVLSLLQ